MFTYALHFRLGFAYKKMHTQIQKFSKKLRSYSVILWVNIWSTIPRKQIHAQNQEHIKKRCEKCYMLTIKIRHSGIFIVKFEHISKLFLVFLSLILNK